MYSFARFRWFKNLEWIGVLPNSDELAVACNLTMEKSSETRGIQKGHRTGYDNGLRHGGERKESLKDDPLAHILGYLVLLIVTDAFYDVVIQ